MDPLSTRQPVLLAINSHDPSGGAGLTADIETAASVGCHCVSAITALNVRDTQNLKDRQSTDSNLLIEQTRSALEDSEVTAIKLGDIASVAQAEAIHTILVDYPEIPVVLDPVLRPAEDGDVDAAVRLLLLPRATIGILSLEHVQQLANCGDTLNARVQELLEFGCEHLLVTNACHEHNKMVNRLFSDRGVSKEYTWELLPQVFHGAGSTLSAAVAAYLAHGFDLFEALQQGQQFTWQALARARRLGMGCLIPDRMYWCRRN